jgi:hypothetical protein
MTDRTIISNQRANNTSTAETTATSNSPRIMNVTPSAKVLEANPQSPRGLRVGLGQRRLAPEDEAKEKEPQSEEHALKAAVALPKPREKNAPVVLSERFNWGQPATLKTNVVYRVLRYVSIWISCFDLDSLFRFGFRVSIWISCFELDFVFRDNLI